MRVAICQSNYIPWRGYFDMIDMSDIFIFHDDIQYTKQDWRNRNLVKTREGLKWLTVPVKKYPFDTTIDRIEIDNANKAEWIWKHRQLLESALSHAPYWNDTFSLFSNANGDWMGERHTSLSVLNQTMTRAICDYLGIKTRLVDARSLSCAGRKTEKIAALLNAVGAGEGDIYLSGPAAHQYLDADLLERAGIAVQWKDYKYAPYSQQWDGFEPNVTVLDLIANVGPYARHLISCVKDDDAAEAAA